MLIRNVELIDFVQPADSAMERPTTASLSSRILDLRIQGARICELGEALDPIGDEPQIDAAGGALLPGLHDHHLHLFALAAAAESVACGPPAVRSASELGAALRAAEVRDGWVRGVGYFESVAGVLDRRLLDRLGPEVPVRVQHRSGAMWVVNSRGLAALGLGDSAEPPERERGIERYAAGGPTGRLFDLDAFVADRTRRARPPSLENVSQRLTRFGVTGLTDATPGNDADSLGHFAAAIARGELRQELVLMGGRGLPEPARGSRISRGPVKLLLRETALPDFDAICDEIRGAHEEHRSVAIHCVTRAELVFASAALSAVGALPTDRIEHAAIAPPELAVELRRLGVCVVTQPNFVAERGDDYLRDVEAADRPWLYRCAGFDRLEIRVAAGTDAPFGDPDPWRAMRAAVERRSTSGLVLGADEAVEPERALALFGGDPARPGTPLRVIAAGGPADLCLLDAPWSEVRRDLDCAHVVATLRAGEVLWTR